MNKGKIRLVLLLAALLLAGCSDMQTGAKIEKELDTGFIPARAGMYDSEDTAVIQKISRAKNTITFFNLVRERSYTLNFDGTTGLYDKYGSPLSMEQVAEGDIVDIRFLKSKKMLASLQKSNASFTLDNVDKFELNEKTGEISVGDSTYRITDDLLVFSKGKQVEIMDINQVDTLKIQGIDRTVYSVSVEKGHGYLRLKNDEYFWGGWIEVGQKIIRPIEEGMLLVVPEGKYDVLLSAKGISGTRKVTVKRDKETELDLGDLKKESVKKFGSLIITVSPDTADVFIDGEPVDISKPVEAEYGIHQLMAKAEDYQTVTKYIKVGQESATIEVVMEKEVPGSVSGNSTTGQGSVSDNDVTSTTGGKMTIDAPTDVEVYLDGSYVGIAPVAFKKTAGIHVITLRATGYETKSYTINIENTTTDESMSFSALVKEEEDAEDKENTDEDDKKESVSDNNSDSQKKEDKKEEDKKEEASKEPVKEQEPDNEKEEADKSEEAGGNDTQPSQEDSSTVSENTIG